MQWLGREISRSHGKPEIYNKRKLTTTTKKARIKKQSKSNTIVTGEEEEGGGGGGGGGRYPYVTAIENRFVSFTYLIVDSKICLLSMSSSEGCPYKYNSG